MKAIILAAGKSSRLGELTKTKPKCCLEITPGVLIIDLALENLSKLGFLEVVWVTGYLNHVIEEHVRSKWSHRFTKISFVYNSEFATKNNSYSAYLIRDLFGDDSFLFNSDIVYDLEILSGAIAYHQKCKASFLVIDDSKPCDEEDMKVLVDEDRIVEINKSIYPPKALGEYIGIMHLNHRDAQMFKTALENFVQWDKYYEDVLDLILREIDVEPCSTQGLKWTEIDTVDDYHYAKELFCAI